MEKILEIKKLDSLYNWWENIMSDHFNKLRNEIKIHFEKIDNEIFYSKWRKQKGYISKEKNNRKILTIAGYINFQRRRYKYFDQELQQWKYVYLADKKIGIEKYERISSHIKLKILKLIASGLRYEDIIKILKINISKMSISNIVNSFNLKEFDELNNYEIEKIKIKECLYIQFDDTFVALRNQNRKKEKYRIRIATFHTGYDKIKSTKNRKVIANKRSFFKLIKTKNGINTENFMKDVYEFAKKFYSNVDDVQIIISGDGAAWIRESAYYWPGSIYIFDKFHAFRKLKQALMIDKTQKSRDVLDKLKIKFTLGQYHELQNHLKIFLNDSYYANKKKIIKETICYFKNNKIGIINQNHKFNIGCHIESDISHNIKWLLGYGSKAFNFKTFQNMLILKISQLNKIDPVKLISEEILEYKQLEKDYYWQNIWQKNEEEIEEYYFQGEVTLNKNNNFYLTNNL